MIPSSRIRGLVEIGSAENATRIVQVKMDQIQWLLGHDENSLRSMGARHLALDTQEGCKHSKIQRNYRKERADN